jgi:acetyl-CoA C-acetyltransferase
MKISVLGAYQTKFGELWDQSLESLIYKAALGAIKKAEIELKDIEIIFLANKLAGSLNDQNHLSALIAELLGINVPVVRVEAACASGGLAVNQACLALSSGQYQTALVIGAEKMTDLPSDQVASGLMTAASQQEQQVGLSFVGLYALMAKKYLSEFQVLRKKLALPAVKNHFHASLNENAHFPFKISLDQVLHSPVIAQPLRLLECSPLSDGAAALVLSAKKYGQKRKNGVKIRASQLCCQSLSLSQRSSLTQIDSAKIAAQKAYVQAGLGPKDLSCLEVHDCFTIAEIIALEDLGLYSQGQAHSALVNGENKLGGKRPVNLSGGLKACGHPVGATGVKQIVELACQLKNQAGKRQMPGAKVGLAHNIGGTGGTAVIHILTN